MGILFLMEKTASDRPLLHISSISLVSPELGLGYYFHALFHQLFLYPYLPVFCGVQWDSQKGRNETTVYPTACGSPILLCLLFLYFVALSEGNVRISSP